MKPNTFLSNAIFLILFSCYTFIAAAQNGHYWTQQYGTRSMLLSGSVIGGVEDLGAVYYNPARISQIDNVAFLLSADVYEYNTLNISDAFGKNANSSKSEFGSVPSLAAGTFKLPFLKGHHFAWAILTRYNANNSFTYKNETYSDISSKYEGKEYFAADLEIKNDLKDQWTGFSWSYSLSDRFSVGASTFLSIVSQGKGSNMDLQALTQDGRVAVYRFNKSFSFTHYNMMFKAGLSYKIKEAVIGLTILAPPLKIKGKGKYQYEEFLSNIDSLANSPETYTTSYQNGLPTEFKSPAAIGLGISIPVKKSHLHVSGEWYSDISEYNIIKVEQHVSQSSGETKEFALIDNLNSVINYGIGFELFINNKISAFTSFSADHSAAGGDVSTLVRTETRVTNSSIKAHYYHFGAGFVLNLKGADITIGSTYTGAKQKFDRPFNFPEDPDDPIFEHGEEAELKWSRWRFVFSFSLPFLKDKAKNIEEKIGL